MRKKRKLLKMSIGGFAVMAGSILLMPFDFGILPGLIFWMGLAAGLFCQRKLVCAAPHNKEKWGMFTFFSGKAGKFVDKLLILMAVILVVFLVADGYSYICYVAVAMTLFLFCLHCIVNGKCFAELTNGTAAKGNKSNNE